MQIVRTRIAQYRCTFLPEKQTARCALIFYFFTTDLRLFIMEQAMMSEHVSLVSAIKTKYNQEELNAFTHIYVPAKGPGKAVSDDTVVPPILSLDNCNVETAGDGDEIKSLCSHVTELELTGNHISDWKEVLNIISPIPNLQFLNLTSNKLDNDSLPEDATNSSFDNIKHLILNKTGASWDVISMLLQIFPSLTELHLSLNSHGCIQLPESFTYPSLTKFHFNGHCIQKFDDLCCLGQIFPNLEHLVSIESKLQTMKTSDEKYELFKNMKCLNISNSKLSSWEDIDVLRKFNSLCDVRMQSIPFLEGFEKKQRRQLVVARLPNVKQLNGSKVTDTEREGAERAFIRYYMDQTDKPDRYYELEAVYGKLDPLAVVNLRDAKRYLSLKVIFEDKEEFLDIDVRQTVKECKKFLQNFCRLPPSKFRLIYHDHVGSGEVFVTEMNHLSRALFSYRVKEEDEFIIERR